MNDFMFYLRMGWDHIVSKDALDHQLFILVLIAVYTIQDFKKVLILVTAFTIGHSLTLALSVFDILRVPSAWVEFLIPCTIAITALINIFGKNNVQKQMKLNYSLALFFGLIHGMGFANSIRITLAKEQSIATGLLGFNIGLELGQIVVILAVLIILFLLTSIFKMDRKNWIMFVSSGVFALSLQMALERIPF
ncbi:HupE/UreJ family protein [Elizabethkingia anophelis]|uniref:HupE/UreJ family protein n=1 Tax=Elizabethkingia TaxID=308865 RepID=UPI00073985BD|nr:MULTISPECIES: HupE/UreJ family protein [Elizabethkingia]KUF47032.1 HupE / UreJ protein [Elizabethkingia anophelis]MCT3642766.1 HupE/UreJ family protein [Elizabethkingia anophelis]MCT3651506.1 HupE/UreJ family protein [Elizabethkingia anophelis]MCT3654133.1 HupE/UreJ family protein [Elizabethkingia anophelis]MCT3657348.1 HupE/UreJ family protein [Elizabethkingia anophelis]